MALIQVNSPGMAATDAGYVSSITVRTGGAPTVLTPNASSGQITVDALAATQLASTSWSNNSKILVTG